MPYPAHHFRVITFDRPGNGRSRWALDPNACAMATAVGRALAVLDATGTGSSVGGSRFLEGSAIVLAGSAAVAAALAMHAFG